MQHVAGEHGKKSQSACAGSLGTPHSPKEKEGVPHTATEGDHPLTGYFAAGPLTRPSEQVVWLTS